MERELSKDPYGVTGRASVTIVISTTFARYKTEYLHKFCFYKINSRGRRFNDIVLMLFQQNVYEWLLKKTETSYLPN